MKQLTKWLLVPLVLLGVAAAPLANVQAQPANQAGEPAVVVSISSIDQLLQDVGYITNTGGAPLIGGMVMGMGAQFSQGLEKGKPLGVAVSFGPDGQPAALAFVPVTNMDAFLAQFRDQIGQPQDVGNGVKQINAGPQPIFVKQQQGYAFIAQTPEGLQRLPQNPAQLLGTLPENYDIAARVNVRNIPEPLRQMAVQTMRSSFEQQLQQQSEQQEGDEEAQALAEDLSRNSIESLVRAIEESEQITFGLAISPQEKNIHLDFSIAAVEGTTLAQQLSQMASLKPKFSGFLQPNAAVTASFASQLTEQDVQNTVGMLQVMRENAINALEEDENLDANQREALNNVLTSVFQVLQKTAEAGHFDGGAVLVLNPQDKKLQFAFGMFVQDGAKLEQAFRDLVKAAEGEPNVPKVTFDASEHQGVSFHTLEVPVQDEKAREVLGPTLNVTLGTGADSAYVAFGPTNIDLLKKVIDQSKSGPAADPANQLNVALGPILNFANAVQQDPNLATLAQRASQLQGQDEIHVTVTGIERGIQYRVLVEEGVISIIGQAIQQGQQAQQAEQAEEAPEEEEADF